MQADYAKTNLVVTVRNTHTRIHVQKDINYFSIEIGYFISLVDSVIHQYIPFDCHEDMPSLGEGGCDRLKASEGALFHLTLLTRLQTRVRGFSSSETSQTRVGT